MIAADLVDTRPAPTRVQLSRAKGWRLALLLACMVFAGCTEPEPQQVTQKRGEARTALFKDCMDLAAKMPRQADDNVAEIVNACTTQAWYMTNHIQ